MPSSDNADKMEQVIEVEYSGVKVRFEPGERATGLIAVQMLVQAGLIPDDHSSEIHQGTSTVSTPFSPLHRPSLSSSASSSASISSSPRSPISPSFNRDLEILDHGCSLGSCTHLLAELNRANLVQLPPGGKLKLTADETPEDFRHQQSRGLEYKKKCYGWDNVRVMRGQMHVSLSLPRSSACTFAWRAMA